MARHGTKQQRSAQARSPYYANYKLYPHEVLEIRYIAKAGIPRREIADHYGISASHVSNLHMRRFWRSL